MSYQRYNIARHDLEAEEHFGSLLTKYRKIIYVVASAQYRRNTFNRIPLSGGLLVFFCLKFLLLFCSFNASSIYGYYCCVFLLFRMASIVEGTFFVAVLLIEYQSMCCSVLVS